MLPTETKEIEDLKAAIKSEFMQTVRKRVVERLLSENAERLEAYYAKMSGIMKDKMLKEFPL